MAMAPSTLFVSVEEYLRTPYRPDVDYVDDHIEKRTLGEFDHGDLQLSIAATLRLRSKAWGVRTVVELRIQVRERSFRIPDICLTDASMPREQIIRHPPLLCIEVLSPEDTFHKQRKRAQDYLDLGVPQVWIFDPKKRTATVCTLEADTVFAGGILLLPGTGVTLDIAEAFSTLDEA